MRRAALVLPIWALVAAGCAAAPAPAPAGPASTAAPAPAPGPAAPAPAGAAAPAPAAAPRPTPAAKLVPPAIPGFRLKEAPSSYGPDTLYELINGAADSFLAFDFEELTALTYVHPSKAEVAVEVYRHRDPERAFGVYAMERSASSTPLPIGVEGHGGRDYLLFVVGSTYVKLALARSQDPALLRAVADRLAAALPGTKAPPAVLTCFPAAGRVVRGEKLAARDFLGRSFLHDAVAVPYDLGGRKFRLFAIRGRDAADVRDMIARYEAVSGNRAARPGPAGSTTVNDPVNGRVRLGWAGRWIWGVVDSVHPATTPLLDHLGAALLREQP
jgi:hypothetical protein